MHTITLITFKGCQSTIDFRDRIESLIDRGLIDAALDLIIVRSPSDALQRGLHGSPTVLIDGTEYQAERRGAPGFY